MIFLVGSTAIPLPRGWREEVYTAVFLLFAAVAVANLVHAGMTKAKYNTEEFNKEHGAAQADRKEENSLAGMLSGVIMLTATIAFLLMGFLGNLWHIAWVVYPVGGILCGIVSTIADYKKQK